MRDPGMGPLKKESLPLLAVGLGLFLSGCGGEDAGSREVLLGAMIVAEDARGSGPQGVTPLLDGLASSDPGLQVRAVRALGRFEEPAQIESISPLLTSPDPNVRAEALNALGQAVFSADGGAVAALLQDHLAGEADPLVRGVLGRTLGRLRFADPGQLRETEEALVALTRDGVADAALPGLLGAVMGLEGLARGNRGRAFADATVDRLEELTSYGLPSTGGTAPDVPRVRRVALMALAAAGGVGEGTLLRLLADPDDDVRRLSVAALVRGGTTQGTQAALTGALGDPSPRVRTQAVTAFAAMAADDQRCEGLLGIAADPDPLVAIAALDLLDEPCPDPGGQTRFLTTVVEAPEAATSTGWHRGAHALLALAGLSPEAAAPLLPGFAAHVNPFARAYAARAAGRIGDRAALGSLAGDDVPNVRTAAAQALFRLEGHDVDGMLLSQLGQDDPQLLLTVAGLLEGTPEPGAAVRPLLETFQRVSATGWETLRDPRMGILERLGEVVGAGVVPEVAAELEPYLSDYDPVVADRVAGLLTDWTGQARTPKPVPAPTLPLPSPADLDDLARTRVILEMEGGGEVEIRLFPHLAPTNAARFARLAESGTLDGLTFHRVVANFVLQGGSPNANEMAGHGAFTRDEIGLQSNWRGTVGTSTRGRDTGDGQLFINLVDNLRLDHNYTVFGEVVAGLEVVDRVVEGQKILRVRVETP